MERTYFMEPWIMSEILELEAKLEVAQQNSKLANNVLETLRLELDGFKKRLDREAMRNQIEKTAQKEAAERQLGAVQKKAQQLEVNMAIEREAHARESLQMASERLTQAIKMIKMATERDAHAKESRDLEAKNMQLNIEKQQLQKQLEDVTRANHSLSAELAEMRKSGGQIQFRMPNFKAFSEGRGPSSKVYSDPVMYINGLPWRIRIDYTGGWIGFSLNCNADKNDTTWSCRASVKFSVVSSKTDECLTGKLHEFKLFNSTHNTFGFDMFEIEELMDPEKCFYDATADTMTFKAKIVIDCD